jgi:S-methylmethionine-dependent homocysteine/selenocysteine methylase
MNLGGRQIRPEQIESYHTEYFNGGQTVVTTVRTLSGDSFTTSLRSDEVDRLLEASAAAYQEADHDHA